MHYLLYIHDVLVQELQTQSPSSWMQMLEEANRKSQGMALATYTKVRGQPRPDAPINLDSCPSLRKSKALNMIRDGPASRDPSLDG